MTEKTMPERIFAYYQDGFSDFLTMEEKKENKFASVSGGAEYVRADLVQGDANETLEDGQYRWVRHKSTPGMLDVARVSVDYDGVWMNETGGDAYKSDQYVYIGPAIRPPEDA